MSGVIFVGDGDARTRTSVVLWMLRYLQQNRVDPAYFRFASSGAESLDQSEAAEISRCCHLGQEYSEMIKYCYKSTLPLHIAARQERRFIDPSVIAQQYAWNLSTHPYVLVDGVGNVTTPLVLERSRVMTQEDLIRQLRLNTVLVTSPSPEHLNQALMTVQYCRSKGLPFKGVILSDYNDAVYYHKDFLASLEYLAKVRVVAMVTEQGFQMRGDIGALFADAQPQALY